MNKLENYNLYKSKVGDFILTFSNVEFQIGVLANHFKNPKKNLDP